MSSYRRKTLRLLCLSAALPCAGLASADTTNCINITSIPTVIAAQGIYCLKQDLATSQAGINAIEIQTNNVTIDCNDHRIGGLAAGIATVSTGIYAIDRVNITVRNCNVRGFRWGIAIYGSGGGHLVEDNRLDQNTEAGIMVVGDDSSIVRRNRVMNTGGRPGSTSSTAIEVLGDVIDNVVDGMHGPADVADFRADGIYPGGVGNTPGTGFVVSGNRVRNLVPKGTGVANGIGVAGTGIVVRDNNIAQPSMTPGQGVYCSLSATLYGNRITNFSQPMPFCYDAGGNVTF